MRKVLRKISILMVALLLATGIAGCKAKNSGNTKSADGAKGESPTEISIFFDSTSTTCNRSNTALIKEVEKKSNTKIKIVEAPSGEGTQKLNLLISSGNCPDIVKTGLVTINKYGTEDAMYPMQEVIDKYMPNVKNALNDDIIKKLEASNNKLYVVPFIRDIGYSGFFVRQDWLGKLGLSIPKTLDEYYKMLKDFTEKDPDGNGKKDTFGTTLTENLGRFELMCGPFGLPANDFVMGDDGNLILSSVHPKMKEALAFGAKLYKEGLIDPEFSTLKGQLYEEKVTNNKIGVMTNPSSMATKYESELKKTVPDAKYQIFDVPVAEGVKKGISATSSIIEGTNGKSIDGQIGISKTTKHLEAVAKFIDWNFTSEAEKLWTYGIEGTHYTMENGKPKFKPEYFGPDKVANRQQQGLWDQYKLCGFYDQRTDGYPQVWAPDTIKNIVGTLSSAYPKLVYFSTPTGETASGEIGKARLENFTKIIMGSVSVDDGWNQWLKDFDRLSGNKWTKEVNDAYKSR